MSPGMPETSRKAFTLRGVEVNVYTSGDGRRYIDETAQKWMNHDFRKVPATPEEQSIIDELSAYIWEAWQ